MSQLIQYTSKELDLLARLMRAEAVGEGDYGMLMVGNVGVNRVLANCYTFRNINTITKWYFKIQEVSLYKQSPIHIRFNY